MVREEITTMDREIEMMLCANHQGYANVYGGKFVGFSIEVMMDIWDILKSDGEL